MKALDTIRSAALYGTATAAVIGAIETGVDLFRYGPSPALGWVGWGASNAIYLGFCAILGAWAGAVVGVILAGVQTLRRWTARPD